MILTLICFILKTLITLILLPITLTIALAAYVKLKYEYANAMCKCKARLDNKVVLVTGGNQGIGLETVRELAARGASVIIACRDGNKAAQAIAEVTRTTGNHNIQYQYLDLAKFSSVRQFAEHFNNTYDRLDILINNAGCAGLKHKTSEDGIDIVMQVNYLGAFLLTNLLLDKLKASEGGRIVIVSSVLHLYGSLKAGQLNGMHTTSHIRKYSNSKLCDILWTKALAKRLPSNVTVNALHPGAIDTEIFKRLRPIYRKWLSILMRVFKYKNTVQGAQTTIHLAVSEKMSGVSGKYFMECEEAQCSSAADDDDLVEQVWRESVRLTTT